MDYSALLAVLQQHANPERAVPMQAYMKHRFNYFGIGKPELARLCRPFFKDAAKQPVDWDFVRRCWDGPHRELQYTAFEYLKKNAAAPDPAGHPAFAKADYRKIMVGQLRRTRPHCRQHRPATPRSQHHSIGMEHRRQHLAAPRHHSPPTAPQTAHRHRATGNNHLQQSGANRIFHQQSHRLGIARLQQNQSRMGTRLYRPIPTQNGKTEPARSGEIFAAEGRLKSCLSL